MGGNHKKNRVEGTHLDKTEFESQWMNGSSTDLNQDLLQKRALSAVEKESKKWNISQICKWVTDGKWPIIHVARSVWVIVDAFIVTEIKVNGWQGDRWTLRKRPDTEDVAPRMNEWNGERAQGIKRSITTKRVNNQHKTATFNESTCRSCVSLKAVSELNKETA